MDVPPSNNPPATIGYPPNAKQYFEAVGPGPYIEAPDDDDVYLPAFMDLPEDQPWPPIAPDVQSGTLKLETPPISHTTNGEVCRIEGNPDQIYKGRATYREYVFQKAAGDCALPVGGKVIGNASGRLLFFGGFIMDRATPLPAPNTLEPSQRRGIMHQMIRLLDQLHAKGIVHGDIKPENMLLDRGGNVRLCDFAEARYVDEDEREWDGATTWHFESPDRLARAERLGHKPAPPVVEDDLYGLGLSIWHLYTGRVPHEEIAQDDLELKKLQRRGETVDVDLVEDEEAREIIRGLLCKGGARV